MKQYPPKHCCMFIKLHGVIEEASSSYALLTYIRDMFGLNPCLDTDYPDGFPHVLQVNSGIVPQNESTNALLFVITLKY
jgi:hypothetical protein